MARTKVREIEHRHVRWIASGMREPIMAVRVSAKVNGYPSDCWQCGATVEKGEGVVVYMDVASRPGDPISSAVHNGCKLSALNMAATLGHETAPPPHVVKPPAAVTPPAADPSDPLREVLRRALGVGEQAPLDELAVRDIVRDMLAEDEPALRGVVASAIAEALAAGGGRPVVKLTVGDKPETTLPDSRHEMLEEALCVLTCPERMLWLVGPTGTGKTYMAKQLADALGVRYFEQACYGASESALVGYATATGDYIATPVVAAVDYTNEEGSKGALLCLDEMDGADESALLALNSLLGGDGVATPRRAGKGHTHRGAAPLYIVATANTEGSGYGTREYNARTKIDDATRDRLVRFRVWVDYDEALERAYVAATGLPAAVADALWDIRARVREHKIEGRHISTRAFKYLGEMNATHPGRWDVGALIDKELATWTPEERAKVRFPVVSR